MANKKTIDEALEIRKSLLDGFTRYGIPTSVLLAVCVGSILCVYRFSLVKGLSLGIFILATLYTIHRKDPKALKAMQEIVQSGDVNFSPFKQSHKKLALKTNQGLYVFLNQLQE